MVKLLKWFVYYYIKNEQNYRIHARFGRLSPTRCHFPLLQKQPDAVIRYRLLGHVLVELLPLSWHHGWLRGVPLHCVDFLVLDLLIDGSADPYLLHR